MHRLSLSLTLVAVLIICSGAETKAASILGEWVALVRTKEGLGLSKTYTKDGTVQVIYGALHEYRYNLAGKKLVISSPPQEPSVLYVELKSSKLILTDIAGNKQKLTRVSGSEKSGIVGKWSGDHHTGRKQVLHFTASRNCYISVPIITENKSYTIKADKLTETFKGKKTEEWQWAIDEDILTLSNITKETSEKYRRKE
jgi:hypothetical protein